MATNALYQPPTVDNAVMSAFGMQPGMDRLNLLPRHDPKLGWIAPNLLYQMARAVVSPGVAARGGYVSPEDAVNFAGNVSADALAASALMRNPAPGPGKTLPMTVYHGSPINPAKLEKGLKGETGYVYHATNADNLREIAESGQLRTHKPWDFTDQSTWPDGSTERRAYFGSSPEHLWQFAPENGQPVVIRTKSSKKMMRESTGDIFIRKPIPAKDIEYLGSDNQWYSIEMLKNLNRE